MSKIINEGLCRQLVAEYFRRTQGGREPSSAVLRELMQTTYAQGYMAARTVPDTHVLVPKEPTDAMAAAGVKAHFEAPHQINGCNYYRAMIEAASQGSGDK